MLNVDVRPPLLAREEVEAIPANAKNNRTHASCFRIGVSLLVSGPPRKSIALWTLRDDLERGRLISIAEAKKRLGR